MTSTPSDESLPAVEVDDDFDELDVDAATVVDIAEAAGKRRDSRDTRRDARREGRKDRVRMSGTERREQLLDVGRKLFAEKGFEAVSVEEIASKANVSKPVVYEHFGGKEGLYAVVVDREMNHLLGSISDALSGESPRALLEQAGLALFEYIDEYPDGFRILVRDTPATQTHGTFASLIVDVAAQVEHLLANEFAAHKMDKKLAKMYSQMLVGMVALTGQWWLDVKKPKKEEVVAHMVNLAWNGLAHIEPKPKLITR